MAKLESFIILTQLLILSSSMIINVCDCNNPRHVGIMDTETPAYCRKEKTGKIWKNDLRKLENATNKIVWRK
jgi:hypothetical protein